MTAEIVHGAKPYVEWGWVLGAEFFLNAIAAGALCVSAMLTLRSERQRPLALLASAVGLAVIGCAATTLLLDVGLPLRVWHLWVMPNWSSPLSWGTMFLSGFLAVAAAHTVLLWRWPAAARWSALLALPLALATQGYTAFVLGLAPGRPLWNQPWLAPLFLLSALCAGGSAVLALAPLARPLGRWLRLPVGDRADAEAAVGELRRLLGLALWVCLLAIVGWLAALLLGTPPAQRGLLAVWQHPLGRVGLLAMVAGGTLMPLLLLALVRRPSRWLHVALALCVLTGALSMRLVVVVGGQLVPIAGPMRANTEAAPVSAASGGGPHALDA